MNKKFSPGLVTNCVQAPLCYLLALVLISVFSSCSSSKGVPAEAERRDDQEQLAEKEDMTSGEVEHSGMVDTSQSSASPSIQPSHQDRTEKPSELQRVTSEVQPEADSTIRRSKPGSEKGLSTDDADPSSPTDNKRQLSSTLSADEKTVDKPANSNVARAGSDAMNEENSTRDSTDTSISAGVSNMEDPTDSSTPSSSSSADTLEGSTADGSALPPLRVRRVTGGYLDIAGAQYHDLQSGTRVRVVNENGRTIALGIVTSVVNGEAVMEVQSRRGYQPLSRSQRVYIVE